MFSVWIRVPPLSFENPANFVTRDIRSWLDVLAGVGWNIVVPMFAEMFLVIMELFVGETFNI